MIDADRFTAHLYVYLCSRRFHVCGVQYGFLDYEAKEGRKLFFHMTEVHDSSCLLPGDEAEFVVVRNQRNGKYSACSLRILGSVVFVDSVKCTLCVRHSVSVCFLSAKCLSVRQWIVTYLASLPLLHYWNLLAFFC